jgi:DnaJ family protein C protein 28
MNPWDVTFKAPQLRASTIRISIFRSGGVHSRVTPDEVAPRERLASARERSLDYSAGLDANGRTREGEEEAGEVRASAKRGRKVMGGMRSWGGIVDERIEEAIRRGDFKKNKGRGKPIPRDGAESNPLMTR